jgi:nucleotide-binding universal stress UspA family protein
MALEKECAVFNKIIVGVDGREGGRDALALAARLSSQFGGELVAVHAYPYDLFVSRGVTPVRCTWPSSAIKATSSSSARRTGAPSAASWPATSRWGPSTAPSAP